MMFTQLFFRFQYVGPDLMLPTMVTLWGLVCTMQGAPWDGAIRCYAKGIS